MQITLVEMVASDARHIGLIHSMYTVIIPNYQACHVNKIMAIHRSTLIAVTLKLIAPCLIVY